MSGCRPTGVSRGKPCNYCTPCTCDCHRNPGVRHVRACCRTCTECRQRRRRQHGHKDAR